jgi:hypothetical protein
MPLVDFSEFDLQQLRQISRELAVEIERKTEQERMRAAEEIIKISNSLGMTVEEILAKKKSKRDRKPKEQEEPVAQEALPVPQIESSEKDKEESRGKPRKKAIKSK